MNVYIFIFKPVSFTFRAQLDRYIPDLREVARVVGGCAALPKEAAENKKLFTRLWVHEALRQVLETTFGKLAILKRNVIYYDALIKGIKNCNRAILSISFKMK